MTAPTLPPPPTPEQVASLHESAHREAQRFVQAVSRLATTHYDVASQLVRSIEAIANNTEGMSIEAAGLVLVHSTERKEVK